MTHNYYSLMVDIAEANKHAINGLEQQLEKIRFVFEQQKVTMIGRAFLEDIYYKGVKLKKRRKEFIKEHLDTIVKIILLTSAENEVYVDLTLCYDELLDLYSKLYGENEKNYKRKFVHLITRCAGFVRKEDMYGSIYFTPPNLRNALLRTNQLSYLLKI